MYAIRSYYVTLDGNQACTHVAYATSEIITIYPITPSSPMAADSDAKAAGGQENIWGTVPVVTQMQSEAGVAGAVHGSLTTGALCTVITSYSIHYTKLYDGSGSAIHTVAK